MRLYAAEIMINAGRFDAVVIGAGHAGCEAALALARTGFQTLILTTTLDNVAYLACNPSIGGTAKGHIVREVDALGGQMGLTADSALLQLRMLNLGKGVAVHSLRAQTDKYRYHENMKRTLEEQENLRLYQGEAAAIRQKNGKVTSVELATGVSFETNVVVIASGVYLKSDIIMGEYRKNIGPVGFAPANMLTDSLTELGFRVRRFKTGTPARVDRRSIDFSKMVRQDTDSDAYPFSFMTDQTVFSSQPCYLTYTTQKTHDIIRQNLHRAPLFSGSIKGVGPRYCPSIEDKVVRFAEKERHQIFIEPEGAATNEVYVQGMSTSMPVDIQEEMYRSVIGLENAVIMRNAYAIEYDCIDPEQLDLSLAYKQIRGIFTAGQINGSSGYEEAAGQGLIAGINAAQYLRGEEPIILKRSDAYIGVLIDDLVTKGTNEPYRMMTARAEYRLHLRQDNADQRLTEIGKKIGLVSEARYERYREKMRQLTELKSKLEEVCPQKKLAPYMRSLGIECTGGMKYCEVLKRGEAEIESLNNAFGFGTYRKEILKQAETEIKYKGYIDRQIQEIERAKKLEDKSLHGVDFTKIGGLRIEARQKLEQIKPANIGQASRISGVSPADVAVLILYLAGGGGKK